MCRSCSLRYCLGLRRISLPSGALDKRPRSKRELLRELVRQAPFVTKNFLLYFRNAWRRHVLRTRVVAPYAVPFYVTHKCNLAWSYCTQKEPDVFSDELPTATTIGLLRRIRKETDSIVITGGEPTLRADIEELMEAARFECKYRSLLLITNGTLLDRKPRILRAVTGLVVSLDALSADPMNPLSKPAARALHCFEPGRRPDEKRFNPPGPEETQWSRRLLRESLRLALQPRSAIFLSRCARAASSDLRWLGWVAEARSLAIRMRDS